MEWSDVRRATERARVAHRAVSAEARDRLLGLPTAERLEAVADAGTMAELTPEHRRAVVTSLAAVLPRQPPPDVEAEEEHQRELAAWWARDTAAQVEIARARAMRRANWWALAAAGVGALAGAALLGWPLALMVAWLCGAGVLVLRARTAAAGGVRG